MRGTGSAGAGARDLADEPGEQAGGDGRLRLDCAFSMSRVDAVEPEDGVKVDQSAALELGDLGIGHRTRAPYGLAVLSSWRRRVMIVQHQGSEQ